MVERMTAEDNIIYNFEDESLQPELYSNREPAYLGFTSAARSYPELGAWLEGGEILVDIGKGIIERYPQAMVKLKGLHNVENAMCALLAARLVGVSAGTIIEAVETFQGFPHRIEFVRELSGVRWYNDSKATNPESTLTALKAFDEPIILILGGRDKGTPLDTLVRLVRNKVEKVILIGEAADRFENALRTANFGNIERAASIEEVVKTARRDARPGRVVLFSPACASFDMFSSFEHRGNIFRKLVRDLPEAGV
jgi:UDP-N-acetylmuramoylalanine--D-glutamate ligase